MVEAEVFGDVHRLVPADGWVATFSDQREPVPVICWTIHPSGAVDGLIGRNRKSYLSQSEPLVPANADSNFTSYMRSSG